MVMSSPTLEFERHVLMTESDRVDISEDDEVTSIGVVFGALALVG